MTWLFPCQTDLRLMQQVRTKNGHALRESRQDGLADAECLERRLVGSGKQVLIMQRGQTQDITPEMRKSDMHRSKNPLSMGRRVTPDDCIYIDGLCCDAT
jgi:hypothetical protein